MGGKRVRESSWIITADGHCTLLSPLVDGKVVKVKLGKDEAKIVRKLDGALGRALAKMMATNTAARDKLYHEGNYIWKSMRATFDGLADVGFRYCVVGQSFENDATDLMHVVFDGVTAVVRMEHEGAGVTTSVSWEAQDTPGWIGNASAFFGRGSSIPEDSVPAVKTLRDAAGGKLGDFFWKMFLAASGKYHGAYEEYMRYYCHIPEFEDATVPVIEVRVDDRTDTILFDDEVVCKRDGLPTRPLPKFFDPVLTNQKFWRGLFNYIHKHEDDDY